MTTSPDPRVTVYIASFNYGKYIREAIESVLRQSYDSWELIVIDDGSSDETPSVLRQYQEMSRVRIFTNDRNEGLTRTSNKAISLAQGEYVVRLDADDYFDENALLVMTHVLDTRPEIALVYPDYYVVSEDGEIIRLERRSKVDLEVELLDLPAHSACSMLRKSHFLELGGYNETIRWQDGYDLWIRLIQKYPVYNVNLPLFYYRRHHGSLTTYTDRILKTRHQIKRDFVEKNNYPKLSMLAIIPVRGVEVMNGTPLALRPIARKPLMDYTIETAIASAVFDRIVVTSDDNDVISHASSNYPVQTVYRDRELARPHSPIEPTVLHTLKTLKDEGFTPDAVALLFVNSPLREARHIQMAVDALQIYDCDSVISVREDDSYFYRRGKHGLESLVKERKLRQERDIFYADTGAVGISKTSVITPESFFGRRTGHIIMTKEESFQIDSEFEFWLVEQILLKHNKYKMIVS